MTNAAPLRRATSPWWRGAVIYQIYPRSFLDTNADGVGDLKGCIEKLEYIASLGVDAIWLSPFFTSPMRDFGYDVADYCDVDPLFGTLAEFDAFIAGAHKRGVKVIIDQVYSHTSDQHAWFAESRSSRDNPRADWYVWADAKPDGAPPNNWQSVFGGGAWEWDARRRQYYFHNFLPSQPDLNLHNPVVQDAILDVARFWLRRGVDGFRLDALTFAMHDPQLRDNPPRQGLARPPGRPYEFQDHRFNQSHKDIPKFIERLRAVTDEYENRFTVAEVVGQRAQAEMKLFTHGGRRLNTSYSFDFLYAQKLTPALVRETLSAWPEGGEWPSFAFSNHDAPRAVSRWRGDCDADQYARLLMVLLMALRGNVFVYQGEELGLMQAEIPFDRLQDPEAIANWPATLGRDGARTPMPWRRSAPFAGFSSIEPWLPVAPAHVDRAVDAQEADDASMLNFTRRLAKLRQNSQALRHGAISFIDAPDDIIAFERTFESETMLCVVNVGDESRKWAPTNNQRLKIVAAVNINTAAEAPPASLPAWSAFLATH